MRNKGAESTKIEDYTTFNRMQQQLHGKIIRS